MEPSKWIKGSKRGGFPIPKNVALLFQKIEAMENIGEYDDNFLEALIQFHQNFPESEFYEYWYARYALAHHNTNVALEYAWKAYQKRKVSRKIVQLMADVYRARGEQLQAWFFEAFCCKHYGAKLHGSVPRERLEDFKQYVSYAMSGPWNPVVQTDTVFFDEQMSMKTDEKLLVGSFFPEWPFEKKGSKFHYWCGIWNPRSGMNFRGRMLDKFKLMDNLDKYIYNVTVFDIIKSYETNFLRSCSKKMILPLAGIEENHKIHFKSPQLNKVGELGKFEYSFFRIEEETEISSTKPFIAGKPIFLEHRPKNKKLVLNILLDGLAWSEVKKQDYQCIPNMMSFFRQGIIFDNNYSVTEYTYPSLPAIETGCTMQRLQVFNPQAMMYMEDSCRTLSERMTEAGYYCSCVMGDGLGMWNGATRGYDRLIVSHSSPLHAFDGIERTIQHMDAFSECDNFIFLHVSDTHPIVKECQDSLAMQTKIPLDKRLEVVNDVVSVWLGKNQMNEEQNRLCIRNVDRLLGNLFDYILSHYKEDEYLVHLYSDHGTSVYSDEIWFLSEEQSHAALMMRGSGIPSLGLVEELTSCLDIYPCVMKNVGLPSEDGIDGNLPASLGGHERKYVISTSIHPLQTFKLCIRDRLYEFRLETDATTEIDGTVDFSKFSYALYTRDITHTRLDDPHNEQRFLHEAEIYIQDIKKFQER